VALKSGGALPNSRKVVATPKLTLIDSVQDRRAQIRAAVLDGSYRVDVRALAVAMIRSAEAREHLELEWPARTAPKRSASRV